MLGNYGDSGYGCGFLGIVVVIGVMSIMGIMCCDALKFCHCLNYYFTHTT